MPWWLFSIPNVLWSNPRWTLAPCQISCLTFWVKRHNRNTQTIENVCKWLSLSQNLTEVLACTAFSCNHSQLLATKSVIFRHRKLIHSQFQLSVYIPISTPPAFQKPAPYHFLQLKYPPPPPPSSSSPSPSNPFTTVTKAIIPLAFHDSYSSTFPSYDTTHPLLPLAH